MTPRGISRAGRVLALLLLAGAPALAEPRAGDPQRLDELEKQLAEARGRLNLLRELVDKGEVSSLQWAKERYNEAETQFLLENYEGAAALLLDAIDSKPFRSEPVYAQALFYLGEALYQTESFLEAKRYFKAAIALMQPGRQYQDAIVRLIDLADRTGDEQGIDQYFDAARQAGSLRPEVGYLYAKWTAKRRDQPLQYRLKRADDEFARLAPGQPYYAQALYFRGVLAIEAEKLPEAAGFFEQVVALPRDGKDPKAERIRGLANLALARVYYEQAKYPQAVDRYQEVSRDAAEYNDALFETAATFVRMGSYDQALRTSDILITIGIGRESPVTPEAKILQGNLQLKLGKFDLARDTFDDVSQTYGPVHDQIVAVLARPDPVSYFNDLLQKSRDSLEITQLLPKKAVPFVNTAREVEGARKIAAELATGRKTADEAQQKATELIDILDAGKLSLFPELQDANAKAVQLSNTLLDVERALVQLQVRAIEDDVSDEQRRELARLDVERKDLDAKFRQLPRTQEQYEERRARFSKEINRRERESFKVRKMIDALLAQVNGLETWLRQGTDAGTLGAEEEAEAKSTVAQYRQLLNQLDETRAGIDKQIKDMKITLSAEAAGGQLEDDFRAGYRAQLDRMQAIITSVLGRTNPAERPLLARTSQARVEIDKLQGDLSRIRGQLRVKALERAEEYRKRVGRELALLEDLQGQVQGVEGSTRELLGEIAYGSFSRVGRQFYDIVLKADVGLIDVAWARKKERSDRISELSKDKELEIKALQERFKEVLTEPP